LDGCILPVRRVVAAQETIATRAGLGIPEAAVVFGAFVSLLKLSPRCLSLWRAILERIPGALLALSPMKDAERPLYQRRLAGFGISAERIAYIPMAQDDAVARSRYRLVDVVLDTVPYTGGDTTAAALDMGVPVVTQVGIRHAERLSYSLLAHLGVTETVAHDDDEYVAIACRLGEDRAWRARVATAIAAKLPDSGLADAGRYARSLESAYERALATKFPAAAGQD
jgi:predicted O-linked N-acetylglucosamine transferase (SPINDLY family)